jgi:hypothetical protein
MTETSRNGDGVAAAAWFDEPLLEGELVNGTWISRHGDYELRLMDIVGADGRHRALLRYRPDGGDERWDDLDQDDVREIANRLRDLSLPNGYILWEFVGPATSITISDAISGVAKLPHDHVEGEPASSR